MPPRGPGPSFADDQNMARYFLFDRLDEGLGDKVALRFGPRSYTYARVTERARSFAALLQRVDVRRGERVLLVLPDVPPFAWALFGTLARGAVVAMGNPHAPAKQIEYLVEYTRATAVVTVPDVARALVEARDAGRIGGELRRIFVAPDAATDDDPEAPSGVAANPEGAGGPALGPGSLVVDLAEALRPGDGAYQAVKLHRDEPAMWLFTSGSTGEPKANVHAHRDYLWNTEVYAKATVGYRRDDVTVSVPRLFFGYATGTNLFFPFAVGATAALFSERPTPESLIDALTRYRPTVVTNVPTMLGKLLDHDDDLRRRGEKGLDLSSVRFSLSAGEALPEALLTRWLERTKSDVYDGIGSAEMFHIYASNRPGDVKPGSLGRAVEGYELTVLHEEAPGLGATPCPPGEIGVLWVKGDSVAMGYWLDRERSFRTFFGHACRTGDLFRMDEGGYLYFAGRADDLLKVSGQWLAPLEVEECLMKHPAVSLAAVVGAEEDGLVKPKAFIVLRRDNGDGAGNASESDRRAREEALRGDLRAHVKAHLLPYKYPRWIEFVDDLPRNDRGKVDKKALRASP